MDFGSGVAKRVSTLKRPSAGVEEGSGARPRRGRSRRDPVPRWEDMNKLVFSSDQAVFLGLDEGEAVRLLASGSKRILLERV